ncbi:winged helix-turn-helix domain-containing protein, partial [Salmonella enterica]
MFQCNDALYLPPKEYAVLVILLEAAGEIVSKNTLLDQVWGDAEV